jgi:cell wall-associated NlpC family hydrolase
LSLNDDIARIAKEWADAKVRYRHRGTSKEGVDCTGLLIGVIKSLGGLQDFELPYYPEDWQQHSFCHNYIEELVPKYADKVDSPIPGDILLFRMFKIICHVGIFVDDDLFVHAYLAKKHVWYAKLSGSTWERHLNSVWRPDRERLFR